MRLGMIVWIILGFTSLHLALCGLAIPRHDIIKDCNAPSIPYHYNMCNITYNDTVRFVCPHLHNLTSATWVKWENGTSWPICATRTPVCELPQGSRTALNYYDSGQYSCQTNTIDYYVNLTVFAPPMLSNPKGCHGNVCDGSAVIIWNTAPSVNITVEYVGLGPFKITWFHNGSFLECQMPHCQMDNTLTGKAMITLYPPYHYCDEGTYRAMVSNSYGWVASDIKVTIDCNHTNPTGPAENRTVELVIGEAATIECTVAVSPNTMLHMCYAPSGTHFNSLNHNNSCVECPGFDSGVFCGSIKNTNDWKVSRRSRPDPKAEECMIQVTTLTISHAHFSDGGTVYCFWSLGDREVMYEKYKTSMVLASKWYYVIGGSVLIALVLVFGVTIGGCYIKRRKTRRRESCLLEEPQTNYGDKVNQRNSSAPGNPSNGAHDDAVKRKRGHHQKRQRQRRTVAIPTVRIQSCSDTCPSEAETTSYSESPPKQIPQKRSIGITIARVHVQDESRLPLLQARPFSSVGSSSSSYGSTGNTDAPLYTHSDSEWDLPPARNDPSKSV